MCSWVLRKLSIGCCHWKLVVTVIWRLNLQKAARTWFSPNAAAVCINLRNEFLHKNVNKSLNLIRTKITASKNSENYYAVLNRSLKIFYFHVLSIFIWVPLLKLATHLWSERNKKYVGELWNSAQKGFLKCFSWKRFLWSTTFSLNYSQQSFL